MGWQRPVPMGQAGGQPPRRHPQPARRVLAGADRGRRRDAFAVHPPDRPRARRSWTLPGSRRRTRWTASTRSHSTACRIVSTFNDPDAKPVRERQYFEVFTNRAIYDQGWMACAQHSLPWRPDLAPAHWEDDRWELYNLDEDFSEYHDLAAQHPDKLAELQRIFDEECERYGVYPFDDRGVARLAAPKPPPGGADPRASAVHLLPGRGPAGRDRRAEHQEPLAPHHRPPRHHRRRCHRRLRRRVSGLRPLRRQRPPRLPVQLVRP